MFHDVGKCDPVWLLYPNQDDEHDSEAIPLTLAVQQFMANQNTHDQKRVTLVFIDSTWKFAREMHRASKHVYPPHMVKVALTGVEDNKALFTNVRRTPEECPSWRSTAEAVAYTVAIVEGNPAIQNAILKPLRLTVQRRQMYLSTRDETPE